MYRGQNEGWHEVRPEKEVPDPQLGPHTSRGPLEPHSLGPRIPAGSSLTGPPPRSSVGRGELGFLGTAWQPGLGAAKAAAALSDPGRPSGPGLKTVLWGVLGSPRASSPESQAWPGSLPAKGPCASGACSSPAPRCRGVQGSMPHPGGGQGRAGP